MKKLISELSEQEINYWVAMAEGYEMVNTFNLKSWYDNQNGKFMGMVDEFDPCNNPAQAWPIIEREKISIGFRNMPKTKNWRANCMGEHEAVGATSLIAAMSCRIAMVYGDSVEVDDE